jgi:hypothetical protein
MNSDMLREIHEIQTKLQNGVPIDDSTYCTFVNTIQGMHPMMIPEKYLEIIKEKYALMRDFPCSNDDVLRAFLTVFNDYMQKFADNKHHRPLRWELQMALFDNWKGWLYPEPCGDVMLQLLSIVKPTRKRRRSLSLQECHGNCESCE